MAALRKGCNQCVNLMLVEACHLNIEAGRKILQDGRQLFITHWPLILFSARFRAFSSSRDSCTTLTSTSTTPGRRQHFQALVATNHVASLLIPDDRLNTAVLFD